MTATEYTRVVGMTATDPALTALLDQADAATGDTVGILARLAAAGQVTGVAATSLEPVELAVLGRMLDRAAAGQLGTCTHLALTPGPCWWAPWAPGRLRCHSCGAAAGQRIKGTKEMHRCDACRRWNRNTREVVRVLPAVVSAIPGLRVGIGPILIVAGYCPGCHPRPTTPTPTC